MLSDDLVHFATHGELSEEAPLFSALVTAAAPGQPDLLSVYELPDLNIHARVIVLSACETALGRMSGGDEVAGLTRVMLTAGADTVVSSLWRVSDRSTAILMLDFHRRLRNGASPSAALRFAELDVRKQFPHPFYWSPFIVTGAN